MLLVGELKVWGWCILFVVGVVVVLILLYLCKLFDEMLMSVLCDKKDVGMICGVW